MKKNTDYTIHLLIGLFLFALFISSCGNKKHGNYVYDSQIKQELLNEGFLVKEERFGLFKITGRMKAIKNEDIDTLGGKVGRYFIDLPEEIGVHNKNVLAAVKNGDTISIVYDEGIKARVKEITREYQIELKPDGSAWVYDGERLVGKLPYREGESFHDLMSSDNE